VSARCQCLAFLHARGSGESSDTGLSLLLNMSNTAAAGWLPVYTELS
jgi:hypothetical protein